MNYNTEIRQSVNQAVKASFYDLKVGSIIMLPQSGETYRINDITPDGCVDMASTKQHNPEMGFDWDEIFFSVKLVNFEIVS